MYEVTDLAKELRENTYPGRGIIIGRTKDGKKAAAAYFIMGRSENSRNRVFIEQEDGLMIRPYDDEKAGDPTLVIYWPIRRFGKKLIVTNGDQTDTVYEFLKEGKTFEEALQTRTFEPDPNFTPRISGILDVESSNYKLSILKSADKEGSGCNRFTFAYEARNGYGHFIHTYVCDGNPIPTFTGEPDRVEIPDDIDVFADMIWKNLNADNKVSLYVKYIDLETGKEESRLQNKMGGQK
ncbi:MAG: IMP cyclohydrolase [Firmicutes bacterium]|nr:IMP cyclohydrolase [Bacillota bacterium]